MDVAVETTGGEDLAFTRDDIRARTDDDGHARLNVRIAGLTDGADVAFLDGDIGFHDAPVVDNQRIGDDGVGRTLPVGDLALAHAVADHLAAAEFHLLTVDGEILFDLDDQIGVGQTHAVAGGGTEHVGINRAFDFYRHLLGSDEDTNDGLAPPPLRGRVREGGEPDIRA